MGGNGDMNVIEKSSTSNGRRDDSVEGTTSMNDERLLLGLSNDNYEKQQLSAAFWGTVWPKLEESGWEKKVRSIISVWYDITLQGIGLGGLLTNSE
jgi:hypothetical protein